MKQGVNETDGIFGEKTIDSGNQRDVEETVQQREVMVVCHNVAKERRNIKICSV